MNGYNNCNTTTAYTEICEVAKNIEKVRKKINLERQEILKCENIIKPYQMALEALNNSLNHLLELKSSLKQKKIELLNIISHNSDTDDELSNTPKIKCEVQLSSSESLLSFDCTNSGLYRSCTVSLASENLHEDENLEYEDKYYIHDDQLNDNRLIIDAGNGDCSSSTITNDKKESIVIINHIDHSPVKVKLNASKRQNESDDTHRHKVRKMKNDVTFISKLENDLSLNCVLQMNMGIILAGSNGLIQLRRTKTLDIMRSFDGYGMAAVDKLVLGKRPNRGHILLTCSRDRFIAFGLKSAQILTTREFLSDIVAFHCSRSDLFVGTKSGNLYTFSLVDFQLTRTFKVPGTFVQCAIRFVRQHIDFILVGCDDGRMYSAIAAGGDLMPVSSSGLASIRDMIDVDRFVLLHSDNVVSMLDKDSLRITKTQIFGKSIRKITVENMELFVLFSDGSMCIFGIDRVTLLPDFLNELAVHYVGDCTLKDVSVLRNQAILIGDSNIYRWSSNRE